MWAGFNRISRFSSKRLETFGLPTDQEFLMSSEITLNKWYRNYVPLRNRLLMRLMDSKYKEMLRKGVQGFSRQKGRGEPLATSH
jgi:hypothetical protein